MDNQTMMSQDVQNEQTEQNMKEIKSSKGVAATVCGIISLIGCLGPISFICGIVAIFVGANARKKSNKTSGTAGIVMGIIGVLISILGTVLIFAVLAGVMAPQIVSYNEKTEISSDTQMCDAVKTALTVSLMDPAVWNDDDAVDFIDYYSDGYYYDAYVLFSEDNAFTESFRAYIDVYSYDEFCDELQSDGAYTVEFCIDGNSVSVRIPGTEIEVY